MEFGPRALGNRSLLADPRRPDTRAILNRRVKHREDFRPFAPSVSPNMPKNGFDLARCRPATNSCFSPVGPGPGGPSLFRR